MYKNIKAEIARNGFTQIELAKRMGLSLSTMSSKLTGKTPFLFGEAVQLKKILKTDLPLEVLFEEAI